MDLERLETALKKRRKYQYSWRKKQNDYDDRVTNFIYTVRTFPELETKISHLSLSLQDYALNRWYNFWSAKGVEYIFSTYPNITANLNQYDKLVDFSINGIEFDHKTSIFPTAFSKTYDYAVINKKELITWLYVNQSQQGRKHLKNRLFICLYDSQKGEHWKMKAEIGVIRDGIKNYLAHFDSTNLVKLDFGNGEILSDIIWVTK